MKQNLIGLDIGGTKCAVIYGILEDGMPRIADKIRFDTTSAPETIENLLSTTCEMMARHGLTAQNTGAIGISCGGPLSSATGVVMSPPNLPGWDNIPIVKLVSERTGVPAALQNDANACALAEYKFGAGRGCRNMAFLTFGTGLGAGLIIDGKLYSGTNDNAGELGHIRLAEFGPVGYGKKGSFEGFASGGGVAQIGKTFVMEAIQNNKKVSWCAPDKVNEITAKQIAEAAAAGDEMAIEIYHTSARYLGKGLSIVIDILNPELIVIGSVYARNEKLFYDEMMKVIREEALAGAVAVCKVVPAALGEAIGDYASLSIAANLLEMQQ